MIKIAKEYRPAITIDGPKGPIYKAKDGVFYIAYLTKLPIIPVEVGIDREWIFNSWDKFRLPKPFSKITISYLKPIRIEKKEDIIDKHRILERSLKNKCPVSQKDAIPR